MAAKTVPLNALLKPAEFSSRLENESKRKVPTVDGSKDGIRSDMHLIPPSKYASVKGQEPKSNPRTQRHRGKVCANTSKQRSRASNSKIDLPKSSTKKQVAINMPTEAVKTPSDFEVKLQPSLRHDLSRDSSVQLLMEIQSCKNQNEKLHQELISQLQKLSSEKFKDTTSADHKGAGDTHDRSQQFHDFVEVKMQKQADSVDRLMQQFLDHQAELNISNEKLTRKLVRVQEEHRDVQLHLEKQLDFKEKQCSDYKQSLQKTENELQELKVKWRSEMSSLESDVKLKDELISALESASKSKDMDLQHLQNVKQEEVKLLQEKTYSTINSLKEELSKCREKYGIEKQEHEKVMAALVAKDEEFRNVMRTKEQEIREIMVMLEERNNTIKLLNKNSEERDHEHLKDTGLLRLEMQKRVESLEENCNKIKSEYEHLLESEKESLKDLKGMIAPLGVGHWCHSIFSVGLVVDLIQLLFLFFTLDDILRGFKCFLAVEC